MGVNNNNPKGKNDMITWTSIGGSWKVRVEGSPASTGDTVQVVARSGAVKTVTLGNLYRRYRSHCVYYLARKAKAETRRYVDPDTLSEYRAFGLNCEGEPLDTPFLYGGEPTTNEDL